MNTKEATPRPWGLLFVAVCLVAMNMRMTITGVGPLLEDIAADQGVSPAALGSLASVPLLAWGIVSPLAHALSVRLGMSRTVTWSLIALAAGTIWRSIPGGPLNLWLGTALIGAALAIGNVLLPAVIRRDFSTRVPLVMGIYTALLGGLGAVSAGLVVPVSHVDVGGEELGWRIALLTTGVCIPLAIVAWVAATRRPRTPVIRDAAALPGGSEQISQLRGGEGRASGSSTDISRDPSAVQSAIPNVGRKIWRDPIAWAVALYMGFQAMLFYMIATWLAPVQVSSGISPVAAGIDVMLYQLISILGSLALPLLYRGRLRPWIAAIVPVAIGGAFAGLMLLPGPDLPWIILGGLGSGASLSISLLFMAIRAREHETASALSGMAQSVGYLIAATGPAAFGLLHEASSGWIVPLVFLLVIAAAQLAVGLWLGRGRMVFERP